MRQVLRFVGLGLCVVSVWAIASCSSSTSPKGDTVPPDVSIYLNVLQLESACPMMVAFYISPLGSRDNVSDRDSLKIRWDFDSDGSWDTSFGSLDPLNPPELSPLPVDIWTVTCEVVDEANNSTVHVESLELPSWLPAGPDILAGEIAVSLAVIPFFPVDTLRVGEPFRLMLSRSDWVESSGMQVTQRYYIDGELAWENGSITSVPVPGRCSSYGFTGFVGFELPGIHEIKVVVDAASSMTETDLENNTSIRQIVVIE